MSEPERYIPPELPENSILGIEDYLNMFGAASDELRYRMLRTLLVSRKMSATELRNQVDVPANKYHYHLNKLVDAGLVENRKQNRRDEDGLYSYYVPTSLGEEVMRGIGHVLEEEHRRLDQPSEPLQTVDSERVQKPSPRVRKRRGIDGTRRHPHRFRPRTPPGSVYSHRGL